MIAQHISSDRLRGRTLCVNKEHVNINFISWGQQWSSVSEREKLTSFSGQTSPFSFEGFGLYLVFGARTSLQGVKGCIFRFDSTTRNRLVGASVAAMC